MNTQTFEEIASLLSQSKDYKVLKRFEEVRQYNLPNDEEKLIGIFLDIETTGLNPQTDKIIELALVPFEFTKNGRIFRVLDSFSAFQDPGFPLPNHISSLTGINDEMVKNQIIDPNLVERFVSDAVLIIAHNAKFDRVFVEKKFPIFEKLAWACLQKQIPWNQEGIASTKLEYIGYKFGFFYEGHRALIDCLVGIHILSHPLPIAKEQSLKILLENARKKSYRIWAENSPYESKDILKARGYKWSEGNHNKPKAWYIEVDEIYREDELNFLFKEVYKTKAPLIIEELTALNRFTKL